MGFPTTQDELSKAGYKFEATSKCKSCGAAMEWWKTPGGKNIPINSGTATPHWATCPHADAHRTSAVRHSRPNTQTAEEKH